MFALFLVYDFFFKIFFYLSYFFVDEIKKKKKKKNTKQYNFVKFLLSLHLSVEFVSMCAFFTLSFCLCFAYFVFVFVVGIWCSAFLVCSRISPFDACFGFVILPSLYFFFFFFSKREKQKNNKTTLPIHSAPFYFSNCGQL